VSYQTVFKNDHFIIVDKRANILSVPSRMGEADPRICLGRLLEEDLVCRIYPVHRLDFEVQGLIMYALTPEAQRAANGWFENKHIQKIYSAITKSSGQFKAGETFEWTCKLLRGKKRAYESPAGKDSLTRARLISIDESGNSHWELEPVTGRSHQLRYELFRHDETIIGDQLYGSTEIFKPAGIALRAFKIDFSKIKNREIFFLPENICVKKLE
jgi:tRNA pseudouridine32 synthase/23S rRNA pseudouridine746 synthase